MNWKLGPRFYRFDGEPGAEPARDGPSPRDIDNYAATGHTYRWIVDAYLPRAILVRHLPDGFLQVFIREDLVS